MKILVFGDSITQGIHDTECGGWADRLKAYGFQETERTDWGRDYSIFNLGVAGDCTSLLMSRFDNEVSARIKEKSDEHLVIFAVGVNDTQRYVSDNHIKTPTGQFTNNLENLHKKALEYVGRVAFVGLLPIREELVQPMPWADDRGHYGEDVVEYDKAISDFCEDKGCLFIPMQDMFDGQFEKYLPDGIHPNAEGHRLIFERVRSKLEEIGIL